MLRVRSLFFASLIIILMTVSLSSCEKDNDAPIGNSDAVFNPSLEYGTMTDQDGNTYKTITIGDQIWMAENLRTKKYVDGTKISHVKDHTAWFEKASGAYCSYNNTENADSIRTYGLLYNGYALASGKIAPEGWHIPTIEEWNIMIDYLGGNSVAHGHLKESGLVHWNSPNTDADNLSGFTALPGGFRECMEFMEHSRSGWWWTASGVNPNIRTVVLDYYYGEVCYAMQTNNKGLSIRCVKD
jgi:uncharacterized protein (TIGR02145 family)